MIYTMSKKIVLICWVSWSWKWTVINNLLSTKKFKYFPSYSTRQIRPWETDGERYIFISEKEFRKSIKNNEFLEYAEYCWNLYGTKKDIMNPLGEKIFIKELELEWLSKIVNEHQIDGKFISIFLNVSQEIMIQRIKKRWAPISAQELDKRLQRAKKERDLANKICDYVLNLDSSSQQENINKVFDILKKEKIL